ncbi:hypothetical protein ACQPYK_49740 (plasmid) [Streptosporangium sp. CA-135522]|uniref:hypothetical protein n=1 Tax=Streptosporangium sp. CA-135522 TaxID=3240072 RepID=UPI003D92CE74
MTAWIIAAIYAAGVIVTVRRIAPEAIAEQGGDVVLGHTIGVLSAVLWPAVAIVAFITRAWAAINRRNQRRDSRRSPRVAVSLLVDRRPRHMEDPWHGR